MTNNPVTVRLFTRTKQTADTARARLRARVYANKQEEAFVVFNLYAPADFPKYFNPDGTPALGKVHPDMTFIAPCIARAYEATRRAVSELRAAGEPLTSARLNQLANAIYDAGEGVEV